MLDQIVIFSSGSFLKKAKNAIEDSLLCFFISVNSDAAPVVLY